MSIFKTKKFAIVDVETSGANAVFDRVIEIGILRVENGEIVERFNSLVNPGTIISPFIKDITGINNEDLFGAPTFEDISNKVITLLDGAVFVAHNARFDYGFIKNELKRVGFSYNSKCLCTVRLSRRMFPEYTKHDLSSLIERFNFDCLNRHRAYDDAKVLWDFLDQLYKSERKEELEESIGALLKENTLPQFLNSKAIKDLPEGAGVYIFYGENNEVLYIGKSKNIRHRVLSHFSNDHASSKEMHLCQQTTRIESIETAGELSALLLESQMVKEYCPIYNRQLRRVSKLVLAKKIKKGNYIGVELERSGEILPEQYKNIVGVFKNISQAKSFLRGISCDFGLCPRVLGLEKGHGACFNHQIKKCSGACIEIADPQDFKKKFKEAFKNRKIKAWPFLGPIVITEKKDDETAHSFVLDNWCLLHNIEVGEDNFITNTHPPKFDYDSYKIFRRYIVNPLNKKNIKSLNKRDLLNIHRETENTERFVYID